MSYKYEREEKVTITAIINLTKLSKEIKSQILKTYKFDPATIADTITIEQPLNIEYCDIISRLKDLISVLDFASVISVNTKEFNHDKCLIQTLFCLLEQIEKKYILPPILVIP